MTVEADVKRACQAYMDGDPRVLAFRVHSGKVQVKRGWMHLAPEGTPDFLCLVAGIFLGVEIKKDHKKASTLKNRREAQAAMAEEIRARGGMCIEVASVAELESAIAAVVAAEARVRVEVWGAK